MTNDQPYLTLSQISEQEIPAIKGSRFIGIALPIDSDAAAIKSVEQIRNQYPDARHWCWAYQLREQKRTRFNDDGEPNGSAGKPILAPIVGRELLDCLVIVVRYFGGTKLGVGGLVRAYSQCANAVLEQANNEGKIIQVIPKIILKVTYNYQETSQIAAALAQLKLQERNTQFSDQVSAELHITRAEIEYVSQILTEYSAGKIQLNIVE